MFSIMNVLKIYFDHLKMFDDGIFVLDLFAGDKVPREDESAFELARPIYSNCLLALAGINASGKTTALSLFELACRIINGDPLGYRSPLSSLPSIFEGKTHFKCLAYHEKNLYLLESTLEVIDGDAFIGPRGHRLNFGEERILWAPSSKIKKHMLSSWDELSGACVEKIRRSTVDGSWAKLLTQDVSIFAAALASDAGHRNRVITTRGGTALHLDERFSGLDDILRVFDPNIEHLEVQDFGRVFKLTFVGREPLVLSAEGLGEVLSSGTIRGLELTQQSMHVLRYGGYLLIDEIENHLNRQLVNVIIDLFASAATNPRGATLVFTTHYPQVLDHIHRKDNVFFLARQGNGLSRIVKYSDRVKRIENKKSEVFSSNYVKGTAPRFMDVHTLKRLVERSVTHV